jgi:ABC-type transport system substrate-binding protein
MKSTIFLAFIFLTGLLVVCVAQQDSLSPDLKAAALKDSACTANGDASPTDPTLETLPIRSGGRDVGTIVEVQGACHCQSTNCDALVYLRSGEGYKLALHEKYASLHPMKIVKEGMPSLTGQFEVNSLKMETTVYDWDGKVYKPSLCATVIKGKKVPSITRHPCKALSR